MVIYQQGNVPTSTRIKFEHMVEGSHPSGGRLQRIGRASAHLPTTPAHLPSECRLGELGRATIMFLLEVRDICTSCKEVAKRLLQVSKSLLQRYTANLIEKLQIFLLFPLSQQPAVLI